MDPRRFDSLAKRLGTRLSRRQALGAGAGLALVSVPVATAGRARAQEREPIALGRVVSVHSYPFYGTIDAASESLAELVTLLEEQPGFLSVDFVEGDEEIHIVTAFFDADAWAEADALLHEWVEENAQDVLPDSPSAFEGAVFLRSDLQTECGCSPDDDDSCGSDRLVCCPTSEDEERGICLTAATTCPGDAGDDLPEETPSETSEVVSEPMVAADTPTEVPSCTGAGCSCTPGIDGACDAGLECCSSTGTCSSSCPCGSEGCFCIASEVNTCDSWLVCCGPSEIGGAGTCQYACTCTGEGCACTVGVDGNCDAGLHCCGIVSSSPGSIGACLTVCSDTSGPCPGAEGCECAPGTLWECDPGLICCGATGGDSGICELSC
ncbi:MAG: hypothetical protein KC438_04380 [Thermomicrobiales bacterium]|nr:hypothetical protein [Thermomicrobiales bacterium]